MKMKQCFSMAQEGRLRLWLWGKKEKSKVKIKMNDHTMVP